MGKALKEALSLTVELIAYEIVKGWIKDFRAYRAQFKPELEPTVWEVAGDGQVQAYQDHERFWGREPAEPPPGYDPAHHEAERHRAACAAIRSEQEADACWADYARRFDTVQAQVQDPFEDGTAA